MTYGWRDHPVGTREGGVPGKYFPRLIILPRIFDGREEAGEAQE